MADELQNNGQQTLNDSGHDTEAIDVAGLRAALKKGGNKGIFNKGVCSTAAGIAAKTVTVGSAFTLEEDALVLVRFANEVTSENTTLSVNNSTAKPIYYHGEALEPNVIKANSEYIMRYDGSYWCIIGGMADREIEDVYTRAQTDTMLAGKVDKVTGKGLSTNDFDNTLKGKLDDLPSTSEAAVSGGTDLSLVTTGEKYNYEDKYTKTQIDALTRHTRLTDFDLNVLKQAVAGQNLEKYGLKPGDQKTINGHTYVIAGLNPMKGTTTPYRVTTNHVGLIVIPHTKQKWNESGNTYTGADGRGAGYLNSDLHYYLKNTLLPLVNTDLGAANLIGHSKLLTNAVNQNGYNKSGEATGCSSNWTWEADCKICALSEVQVYGAAIWSSSGYDTGEACRQLEVFQAYSHTEIFGGEYPWLRDVVSASSAAFAYNDGRASIAPAPIARYVAALILFH